MHLRRLKIHSLPGIERGFAFEPLSDKVNIVTGPNAIGKSSLARALKYLLADADRRSDPPDLHLEAEFLSGDASWTVRRTGRQVAWMRNGESAARPPLPSANQFGLYRLSMESLLDDDVGDQALADALWRTLRGGFDLDRARRHVGSRFGSTEARNLRERGSALRKVEGEYSALRTDEADLPSLARRIAASEQASIRVGRLQTAMQLHRAIGARQTCVDALEGFSAHLENLHGDEFKTLKDLEGRSEQLRKRCRTAEIELKTAEDRLERTGLRDARPDPEEVSRIERLLRDIDVVSIERNRAGDDLVQAEAALGDAKAQLWDNNSPPELDLNSLERAREIIEPLADLHSRRSVLQQRLDLTGEPPDESEIGQLRDGVQALRAWLAAKSVDGIADGIPRTSKGSLVAWIALVLVGITALAAYLAGAWWALAGSLATGTALILVRFLVHARAGLAASPLDDARRRFADTGLEPPPRWSVQTVNEHLRRIVESRLDDLLLQKERAEGVQQITQQLKKTHSDIAELEASKNALAEEIGIDPNLTGAPLLRFVDVTRRWNEARADHARKNSFLEKLDARILEDATRIRGLLAAWRDEGAPRLGATATQADLNALRIAFESLDARLKTAIDAQGTIDEKNREIAALNGQINEVDTDITNLFGRAGLEVGAQEDLAQLIDRLEAWQQARAALAEAEGEEKRLRLLLAGESELVGAVEGNAIDTLGRQLRSAEERAGEHTDLIKAETAINTRLQEARKSHKLEDAARETDHAAEALKDKRDEVLLHTATEVLLNEVENAFKTEREPDLLRKARRWFEQVTAHAFTLELQDKDKFVARDRTQGQLRTLEKLSSGTRMQLLLALRLAWTEDRERGGESLPLFLDEALTTSDEGRFSVMAQTLSLLAENEGRQIFYLSARRHEATLWKQATGTAPGVIDLAAVRFGSAPADPDSLRVETPPSLPLPNGLEAETYAIRIDVHPVDPRADAGGVHLFHLLRDDLSLLHRLLDTWRVGTLGQLESLLSSDAAGGAISDHQTRQRLLQRCQVARLWSDLWRQGRGRPVDRAVLDQCPAVSDVFLDRAADLSRDLEGDGEELVRALQAGLLKGFYTSKTNELDEWLADKGYIDDALTLEPEERRRLTLQQVVSTARPDAEDVNRVIDWMESAIVS